MRLLQLALQLSLHHLLLPRRLRLRRLAAACRALLHPLQLRQLLVPLLHLPLQHLVLSLHVCQLCSRLLARRRAGSADRLRPAARRHLRLQLCGRPAHVAGRQAGRCGRRRAGLAPVACRWRCTRQGLQRHRRLVLRRGAAQLLHAIDLLQRGSRWVLLWLLRKRRRTAGRRGLPLRRWRQRAGRLRGAGLGRLLRALQAGRAGRRISSASGAMKVRWAAARLVQARLQEPVLACLPIHGDHLVRFSQ